MLDGVKITTLESVSFFKNVEKKFVFGESYSPLGISAGLHQYGGEITIRQSDFDRMSLLYDVLDFDAFFIIAVFGTPDGAFSTYTAANVGFTQWGLQRSMKDYYGSVTLPFICEKVTLVNSRLIESVADGYKKAEEWIKNKIVG